MPVETEVACPTTDSVASLDLVELKLKSKQKITNLINKVNPIASLRERSSKWKIPIESALFATRMDQEDPLASFRNQFEFPKKIGLPNIDPKHLKDPNEECVYLCGQSLGLKPKATDANVKKVLDNWCQKGVDSHFHGYLPAALSDLPGKKPMARIVGAKENEISILNALTVNLHLLLATFYQPDSKRYKIIIEQHAFPSDTYVVKSQLRSHGISPDDGLIELKPRKGEDLLNEDDIISVIEEHGDKVKVALFPAVQYYTGQLLNVKKLTQVAQSKGIIVGVDLAHAVGNVPLYLDEWDVDFAAWCTYKYMNSGAGGIGAIYVNERYFKNRSESFPAYQGWWGNNNKTKFMMSENFDPASGADMFKLSNPSPVLNAMLMTSLEIFEQTSIEELRQKQFLLTGYLEYMIKSFFPSNTTDSLMPSVKIITPANPEQRGAQLSLIFSVPLSVIHEQFQKRGIVCDIRMPSVMRVAPAPLYNSFTDVYRLITTLHEIFQTMNSEDLRTESPTDELQLNSSSDSEAESSLKGSNTL